MIHCICCKYKDSDYKKIKQVSVEEIAKICFDCFVVNGTWKNLSSWDKYKMAKDFNNSRPYKLATAIHALIYGEAQKKDTN